MTQLENGKMREVRIAAFKANHQNVTAWCLAHDVKAHQLRYWIRRFDTSDKVTQATSVKWLAVDMEQRHTSEQSNTLPIRIGQATIKVHILASIPHHFPRSFELLLSIEACCSQQCRYSCSFGGTLQIAASFSDHGSNSSNWGESWRSMLGSCSNR